MKREHPSSPSVDKAKPGRDQSGRHTKYTKYWYFDSSYLVANPTLGAVCRALIGITTFYHVQEELTSSPGHANPFLRGHVVFKKPVSHTYLQKLLWNDWYPANTIGIPQSLIRAMDPAYRTGYYCTYGDASRNSQGRRTDLEARRGPGTLLHRSLPHLFSPKHPHRSSSVGRRDETSPQSRA